MQRDYGFLADSVKQCVEIIYFADEALFQLNDSLNKQIKKHWSADGQSNTQCGVT